MMEGLCIPCRYGNHDRHIEYPEIPAPGVMGGHHCPCWGECDENFKVSNTPQGTRQTQRTPGTPDPQNRKDRSP